MARGRRGNAAVVAVLSTTVVLGAAALALEVEYTALVDRQLQAGTDAAAHAAWLELDGTAAGLDDAVAAAREIAELHRVDGEPLALDASHVEFGWWSRDGTFVRSDDPTTIDAVRITRTVPDVTFGLAFAAFGVTGRDVASDATVIPGPGNASTGDLGGPGLVNGHFDVDTVVASLNCKGSTVCGSTFKHTHEYDDQFDATYVDLFAPGDSHLPITGCLDSKGKAATCSSKTSRVIPDTQRFRITVVNADLSPGAWLRVNGVDTPVTEWDEIPIARQPQFALGSVSGVTRLRELEVWFDVTAIASCELHPTNTSHVRSNVGGADGEWRNGAMTVQLVTTTATTTAGKSTGDHDVVAHQNAGLLYESTYFWHWDGPSHHEQPDWTLDHEALRCAVPVFTD